MIYPDPDADGSVVEVAGRHADAIKEPVGAAYRLSYYSQPGGATGVLGRSSGGPLWFPAVIAADDEPFQTWAADRLLR